MNRRSIADDESIEVPRGAKDIVKKPAIARCGYVVEVLISAHHGADSGIDGGLVRGKVDVPKQSVWNVGGVVIASTFGGSVGGEMFHGGDEVIRRADVVALESADLRTSHGTAEEWIFTRTFDD